MDAGLKCCFACMDLKASLWRVFCSWKNTLGQTANVSAPVYVVNMKVPTLKFTVPEECKALGKKRSVRLKPGFVCLGVKNILFFCFCW